MLCVCVFLVFVKCVFLMMLLMYVRCKYHLISCVIHVLHLYTYIYIYIYTYFVVVIVDGAVDVGSWQLSMLEVAKKQKCGYRLTNFIDLDASNLRETKNFRYLKWRVAGTL